MTERSVQQPLVSSITLAVFDRGLARCKKEIEILWIEESLVL